MPTVKTTPCAKCGKPLDALYHSFGERYKEEDIALLKNPEGVFCDFYGHFSCFKEFCEGCYDSKNHICGDWTG